MNDYIAYPARGTGTTAGIRMTSCVWHALKASAEAAGAPTSERLYTPVDSVAFAKAAVRGLAAAQTPQVGARLSRMPANVPVQSPSSALAEPVNFARVTAVIALFAQGDGIVVEKVSAAENRANVVR
ncbi:MAG TPA: hypothetical protein VH092_18065 [Urbifossiella sp.]|jgi:hypothetical protein|nr:hypothetical protein [Urbifossiella sp.]